MKGVDLDYAQAMSWWEKAAAQGNTAAMFNLGYCYMKGEGTDKNPEKAFSYFLRLADAHAECICLR